MYRPDHLSRAVKSVVGQLDATDRVLVLDQCVGECGCGDSVSGVAGIEIAPRLTLIKESGLSGAAQARNFALAHVSTPLTLLLDDDAELLAGGVDALREAILKHNLIAAGVMQRKPRSLPWFYWYRIFRRGRLRDQRQELNLGTHKGIMFNAPLPGGGAMVVTEVARRVKFDERYISYSMGEDVEFTNRLRAYGRTALIPNAVILHERAGEARDRSPRTEMRDAVASLHYIFLKLPDRAASGWVSYAWAQVGLLVRALVATTGDGTFEPLRGWRDGWSSVRRGMRDLPFLRSDENIPCS